MNRLKDDLDRELKQQIYLKNDVKKRILEQAKNPIKKSSTNWQYPVVLVACASVLILFAILLFQDVGGYEKVVTGAEADSGLQLDWLIKLLPYVILGGIILSIIKFFQPLVLPVCENCYEEWSWRFSIKKMFILNRAMSCPSCGENQYQTRKSRIRMSQLVLLSNVVLLINAFFDFYWWEIVLMYVAIIATAFILLPYNLKLQNDEDLKLW
ncbi:TIGR04104 family putative zinc finger protein [Viridibacillus sp. NPDC093762]|uniref:TIGR04104 family putative zinc finger protein n=1 Tax=Viridibacillus sp. NPDC093762 TaxID=3390720 RepID=UPI003D0121B1